MIALKPPHLKLTRPQGLLATVGADRAGKVEQKCADFEKVGEIRDPFSVF
jgi:hypothetical protein